MAASLTFALAASCSLLVPSPATKPSHSSITSSPASPFGDPLELHSSKAATPVLSASSSSSAVVGLAALLAAQPDAALAKGGEFGIFEGRIVSLAHPSISEYRPALTPPHAVEL